MLIILTSVDHCRDAGEKGVLFNRTLFEFWISYWNLYFQYCYKQSVKVSFSLQLFQMLACQVVKIQIKTISKTLIKLKSRPINNTINKTHIYTDIIMVLNTYIQDSLVTKILTNPIQQPIFLISYQMRIGIITTSNTKFMLIINTNKFKRITTNNSINNCPLVVRFLILKIVKSFDDTPFDEKNENRSLTVK